MDIIVGRRIHSFQIIERLFQFTNKKVANQIKLVERVQAETHCKVKWLTKGFQWALSEATLCAYPF